MCNLYSNTTAQEAMRQLFDVVPGRDHLGNAEPKDAIYPKHMAPVVRLDDDVEREMVELSWGFRKTNKSKKTGNLISPAAWNNARDDKVATNGLWKGSFEHRRCLVPASSFCEAKGRNPATYYWFGMASDDPDERPPFAFAGIWRESFYETKDGPECCLTHTIITTSANELVKPVHPQRMPVILDPADYEQWLRGDVEEAQRLLRPFPEERMRIVRKGVGVKADPFS